MAITYGMSVKEFWEDDPDLFWAYRFSYLERQKSNQEMFNDNAWLQGAYFYEAISVALCNAFGKSKLEYSKKPYGYVNESDDKQEKTKKLIAELKGRVSQVQSIKNKKQQTILGEKRTGQN